MLFAILCEDKPGALELRMETRPAHLDYLKSLGKTLKFAGPFLTEKEQTPCGSLVVIEAEDAEAAKAIADKDPYAKAGLFESVAIRPCVWAINNPES